MLSLRSRPKISAVPAIAAAALVALGVALGNWQSGRALEKDVIEARHAQVRDSPEVTVSQAPVAAEAIDGRRVAVRGEFLPARSVYWDNQVVDHRPGLALITPLRLEGSQTVVLVDRGLLPAAAADRSRLPRLAAPAGTVEVHGRAYLPPARTLELKGQADQGAAAGDYAVWENLSANKYARASGMQVQDFILREAGAVPAGLARAADNGALSSAPDAGGMTAARHRGYAFQWYALAALTALLFVLFTFMTHDNTA